jgi:hypothetical protein
MFGALRTEPPFLDTADMENIRPPKPAKRALAALDTSAPIDDGEPRE